MWVRASISASVATMRLTGVDVAFPMALQEHLPHGDDIEARGSHPRP
jgi:hypothetical protein